MTGRDSIKRRQDAWSRIIGSVLLVTVAVLAAAVLLTVTPAMAKESVAKDAQLGGDAQQTRFVTVLSKKVRFGIRTLADPYRVVIDLSDVRLELPKGRGSEGRGLVTGYRYGRVEPYGVRIILDVNAPVLVHKAAIWESKDGKPPRLVVDIVKTDRASFMARQKQQLASLQRNAREAAKSAKPQAKRKANAKKVIVIDPGHGGIDPGAVSKTGLQEKTIVFAFSKQLRDLLNQTGRYHAVLTRSADSYIALRKRVDKARELNADLFLSIHADALPGRYADSVSGATVYTLSEKASDDEARELAAKENKSDIIAGVALPDESDDVANILIDLAQRETKNLSITFAGILVDGLAEKTKLTKKYRKYAGFRVLKAPDVPSILLELGYMTNESDVRRMQSSKWRATVAAAITKAIDKYFGTRTAHNPY